MERMEEFLFLLLLKEGMNKLFNFYWKKETQMLTLQIRFFCWFFLSLFLFFFFFSFSLFYFFNVKNGITPLYVAAFNGDEQIVQILLEKGNPNVDLPDPVIVLFVIILNLLILFFQSLHWKQREGGWILIDICFVFYFLKFFLFWNLFFQVWVDPSSCCCF